MVLENDLQKSIDAHLQPAVPKDESKPCLVQNVADRVRNSMGTDSTPRDPNPQYDEELPPPPELSPPTPPRIWTPYAKTDLKLKSILKNAHDKSQQIGERSSNVESSTSGYSTVTETTKSYGMNDSASLPQSTPCSNDTKPSVLPDVKTGTGHSGSYSKQTPSYNPPPPISQSVDSLPSPPPSSVHSPPKPSTYALNRSTHTPKHKSASLNHSFQRAVHDKLKKYAGRPQESWESQIEKDLGAGDGEVSEKLQPYAESDKSGELKTE